MLEPFQEKTRQRVVSIRFRQLQGQLPVELKDLEIPGHRPAALGELLEVLG